MQHGQYILIAEKHAMQSLLICDYNATIDTTTATIDTTIAIIVTTAAAAAAAADTRNCNCY